MSGGKDLVDLIEVAVIDGGDIVTISRWGRPAAVVLRYDDYLDMLAELAKDAQ